ncbi:hypothetical protein KCTC52924_01668 [Arenibacter antarcticus]|uniref:Beta-lactamase-inhibitor-like, PepSY-like n=1 Tax=Arenibacter antarcticus TaxID=2040469 RepID=A0ABW5VHB2_9FLAO|nr:hypothetical protein [Arenibacter sp. H213]MCM4166815.1 hypothetical protein [Arenibacter sp. H213]
MRYKLPLFLAFLILSSLCFSQSKPEREHRIKKSQFPIIATAVIPEAAKRIRYYKEIDTVNTLFTLKFKLKRMKYEIEVDDTGEIEQLGFLVKEVDIPRDVYSGIHNFLNSNFQKVKIKRILQWYPADTKDALKNTFQNLILPTNTYGLLVRGKKRTQQKNNRDYMLLFNSEGKFLKIREALPVNFDRVLY